MIEIFGCGLEKGLAESRLRLDGVNNSEGGDFVLSCLLLIAYHKIEEKVVKASQA